ncbi:MAG: threonine-phosphate decarboxylase CobD [Phyllobacterium sp.]
MVIEHGGALDRAVAQYGGQVEDWLDLSTGINPEAFPIPGMNAEIWNRLPDQRVLDNALQSARDYYGVPSSAGIMAGPGTQALIQIIPELVAPGDACILWPTYEEHEASFVRAGWKVSHSRRLEDIPDAAKVVAVVNPNNPDGRIAPVQELIPLADRLAAKGGFLVVDEAFADPHPEMSIAAHAGREGLIVLKSFGKFFGLAGLRLGFAITDRRFAGRLSERLGPWAVSGPALVIAAHAFSGGEALQNFTERLAERRQRLSVVFPQSGLREAGGTMLFSLVETRAAQEIYEALCEQRVLVRKFAYAPNWLRFGLPLDEADAQRLGSALEIAVARTNAFLPRI